MIVYSKPNYAENLFFHVQYQDYPILHTHDYWEFMLVLKGTIVHKINGKIEELKQNTLCLIRPQDVHSLHNKKKQISQHLNLGMDAKYFQQYMRLLAPSLYNELQTAEKPVTIDLSLAKVNRIFNDVNKVLSAEKSDYEMQLKLLFLDVVREFFSNRLKSSPTKNEYSTAVSGLILLMNNPENMKRDLSDIMQENNYSYSHTNRIFAREVGCTPSHYFRNKKFEYAKTLIGDTDMSLSDIAFTIGYKNYSHFSTAFKKYTGVAPIEFGRNKRDYYQSEGKASL